MIIPGQFGFNCPSDFREEAFWNIFPIGSNVKLSPAVEISADAKWWQCPGELKSLENKMDTIYIAKFCS
jgi:hypothetical protein